MMEKDTAVRFGEIFTSADKLLDAKSLRSARQLEKDYWNFDPRNSTKTMEWSQSETFAYITKREKRFFSALLPLVSQAGYRCVTRKDVAYARVHGFQRYRFKCNWGSLSDSVIDRNIPALSRKYDEDAAFEGRVAIFVRGEGVVSTSGYFLSDKYEAVVHRFTDSLYYHASLYAPRAARLFNPDYDEWMENYLEKQQYGHTNDTVRIDIDDQLSNATTSLRRIFGVWTLREPTFKSVIVLFRRNRPAQTIDPENLWRSGGTNFNRHNIELRQYVDVPKTDLELLLPEKSIRQKPLDYVALTSMTGLLGWTLYKVAHTVLSFTQMTLVGMATTYATRLIARWRSNQVKYTHTIESLRARNHKAAGSGTLRQLEHAAMSQLLKQAMIVYLVLLKEHARGGATHWWDSHALDAAVYNELRNAMKHGVYKGYFNAANVIRPVPGELAVKVTSESDIGGLGLWTYKTEGATLGLRVVKPEDALQAVRKQWMELI
eukprot:TRINITY_DN6838_c0_g2_i1.p1 TRINITY_DN6838_c0_g2~~TRINITY_DN6838_c0_g2_i1.p1  ORF type:complete len:557 (+),score=52.05 TRINITY_DN6838_c0_g2_i1:206-1672(+)